MQAIFFSAQRHFLPKLKHLRQNHDGIEKKTKGIKIINWTENIYLKPFKNEHKLSINCPRFPIIACT